MPSVWARSFSLHVRQHMAIKIERNPDCALPWPLADNALRSRPRRQVLPETRERRKNLFGFGFI